MRESKIVIYVCSLLIILFLILTFCLGQENETLKDIFLGIVTGCIVSLVTSVISYFSKKQEIVRKIKSNVGLLYLNMLVICKITDDIVQNISFAQELNKLKFGSAHSLSMENRKFIESMEVDSYSGFSRFEKYVRIGNEISKCKQDVFVLINKLSELIISALKFDNVQAEINIKFFEKTIPFFQLQLLAKMKLSVIINTARTYEHGQMLINNLDCIGRQLFIGKGEQWENMKLFLEKQANSIYQSY